MIPFKNLYEKLKNEGIQNTPKNAVTGEEYDKYRTNRFKE